MDFEKVFDFVEHKAIWKALLDQGIEPAYVALLQRLYDGQEAVVHTDERSMPFKIEKGTKQGHPISPIFFNAVLEYFMKQVKQRWKDQIFGYQRGKSMEDKFITNLRYADDILLIVRSLSQIKTILADLDLEAANVGLKIHSDKTKIHRNNIGSDVGAREMKCGRINVEILLEG